MNYVMLKKKLCPTCVQKKSLVFITKTTKKFNNDKFRKHMFFF